jgi:phosphatidylserine decarboxylase
VTLLTIYITAFFRTLEPQVPGAPEVAVLPADGRIVAIVVGAGQWRISFGSRTDFILPPKAEVQAEVGDIV